MKDTTPMDIIIGLGNPGDKYENTRHNAGFMAVDVLREKIKATPWKKEKKTESLISKGEIKDKKVLLIKPQLFMNNSGIALNKVFNFYDHNIINITVIYDDIDIPFSEIKVQKGGGSGGHKGVESIIHHTKVRDFIKIRIGIGRPEFQNIEDYVLQEFTEQEKNHLDKILEEASYKAEKISESGYDLFIAKYNK